MRKDKTSTASAGPSSPVKGVRRNLSAEQRRAEVLDGARTVFATRGLNGARVRDIATASGANIATVFAHFPSKEALFEAAVADPLEKFFSSLVVNEASFEAGTQQEKLSATWSARYDYFIAMQENVAILSAALLSDPQHGSRFYKKTLLPFISRLADLSARVTPGLRERNIDPFVVSLSTFGMYLMLALHNHYGGEPLNPKLTVDTLTEYLSAQFYPKAKTLGEGRPKRAGKKAQNVASL